MKYVSGVDIGTTGVKVIIFDQRGNQISSSYREFPCIFPQSGWCEQDSDLVWGKTCEASKAAIEKSNIKTEDIISISLSNQRCTIIPVDKNGKSLRTAIVWQDRRSTEECNEISQIIGNKNYYEITGLPVDTTWSVSKILWIKKHQPEIYKLTHKFILYQESILNKLGVDGYFEDWSNASLQGLMNIKTFTWNDELIEKLGIDKVKLPELVPSGKVLGRITDETSKITGFAEGTLLVSGGGDQQCAGIGAGAVENGIIEITIGTAGVALVYLDKCVFDSNMRFPCSAHAIPGKWETEGLQLAAGSALKWYRNEIAVSEVKTAEELGTDPYKLIDEQIKDIKPGAGGVICIPYFAGSAAPNWDPFARGTFIGLSLGHNKTVLARAIMEGVIFEAREIIEQMMENGIQINHLVLSGGASKSDIWNQIQADIYGKPCSSLEVEEATALGAAILAALGVGLYKSINEAVKNMVKIAHHYFPNPKNHKVYSKYFNIYKDAYQALKKANVYERLVKLNL